MDVTKIKDNLKEKVTGASEFLGDLKEGGKEKFIAHVNSLSDIIPIIAQTGYQLKGIDMDVTIPPGVNMHFEKFKNISDEEIGQILDANKGKELLRSIVKALVTADEFHKKLKMGDLLLTDISIGLSLPPKVTIKFVKKKSGLGKGE
jgi:hypothetical protein